MNRQPVKFGLCLALLLPLRVAAEAAPDGDRETEEVLRRGKVVAMRDIGVGISRPKKVTVRHHGATVNAAFKTINQVPKHRRSGRGRAGDDLCDRYRYERAAYLLDRRLGIGMVPVAVLRRIYGRDGVLVAWVEGAIDEGQRLELPPPPNPLELDRQRSVMRLFDALIANADRNPGNQLYTTDGEWRLHLIDHSRSFPLSVELPARFLLTPASLDRRLYDELASLTEPELARLLRGLVDGDQVRALLARRDRILAKIDADRIELGDERVLLDGTAAARAEAPPPVVHGGHPAVARGE